MEHSSWHENALWQSHGRPEERVSGGFKVSLFAWLSSFVIFRIVNFSLIETVYGFTQESLVLRKTCNFDVFVSERDGDLHLEMKAKPLEGTECLHRDTFPATIMEEETDELIMKRDDLFFKNLDAIEHTFTVAAFDKKGVRGDWLVNQDDMYSSNARFKNYFQLHHDKIVEKTNATIQFAIKDYDMVGPADFHQDRSLDKLRSG